MTIDNKSILPKYVSSTINKNEDGTYNIKHIFIDEKEQKILVEYPRVMIEIDYNIDIFRLTPNVFPFYDMKVLSDYKEEKKLFTITIEE